MSHNQSKYDQKRYYLIRTMSIYRHITKLILFTKVRNMSL